MLRRLLRDLPAFVLMLLAGVWCANLTGCNTVEGVGEDVEEAGDAIEDTANDVGDNNDGDDHF